MFSELSRRFPASLPAFRAGSWPARSLAFVRDWGGMPLVALLALISALIYVRSPLGLTPIFDDAFISLTFATNLAEHGKLSYDGVSWSTGATSFLHVSLLAALIKLGVEPVLASYVVGVGFLMLLAAACYLLAWAVFRRRFAAILAGVAICFVPYAALDAGNGLETTLFLSLVTLAVASFLLRTDLRGRALTGLLIGAAALTRPEGAILVPAVLIYRLLERRQDESLIELAKESALLATPGFVAAGMVVLYSLVVGDTLGGTATAKMHFFQENNWRLIDKVTFAEERMAVFAAPLIPLIAVGALVAHRREVLLFALFLTPLFVLHGLYFPGGMEHYFFRYQHPALPFIAVLAGGGGAYLIAKAASGGFLVKVLVVLALGVALIPVREQYERWRVIYRDASNETHSLLVGMAKDLNTIIEPHEVLATHDIGAVGYYGDYLLLDLVGLINPKVVPYHKDRRVAKYVEGARPDYLLIFPQWDWEFLHIFPGNAPEKYELVKVYPGGTVRLEPYVLYRIHWRD